MNFYIFIITLIKKMKRLLIKDPEFETERGLYRRYNPIILQA